LNSDLIPRPSWRFLLSRPAHLIAFGFGAGLVPVAPGTWGTLLAFPLLWLLQPWTDALEFLLAATILFGLGVWACDATGRALGVADHGGMVWDETVAFLLVLFFTPSALHWQALAFLIFRLFDILKPPPIRYYDRTLKNGFGVMFDDLIAAFYTLLVLAVAKTLLE
jgi:phosphatidylglycerophosphatase A